MCLKQILNSTLLKPEEITEFYLSAFSKNYGMEVQELYLAKVDGEFETWINVNNLNEQNNGRNTSKFDSNDPVYIIAIIRKNQMID